MVIKCKNCGHEEEVNTKLIGSILGSATAGFGMFAWTSFLFAGTGMAAALCTAIVAGGPAVYAYKDEILKWLIDKGYKCKQCGGELWQVIPESNEIASLEQNLKNTIDPFEEELTFKITKMLFALENNNKNWYELISSTSSKINDLNIFLVKELYKAKNLNPDELTNIGRQPTQANKIKMLEDYYSKDITSSLFFINNLRNKLIHPDDYGLNLNSLT